MAALPKSHKSAIIKEGVLSSKLSWLGIKGKKIAVKINILYKLNPGEVGSSELAARRCRQLRKDVSMKKLTARRQKGGRKEIVNVAKSNTILELLPDGKISPKTTLCSPAAMWCGQQSPTDLQGKDSPGPRAPLSPSNTLCHAPSRDRALPGWGMIL